MRRIIRATFQVREAVRAIALATIGASIALIIFFVFFEHWGEEFTSGRVPTLFYEQAQQEDVLRKYINVFGVAHNSGGTVRSTRKALAHGADVIEIDVSSVDGVLVSAHFPPLPLIGRRLFRGPSLAEVWDVASEADVIKLDLKESSDSFLRSVFSFINERSGQEVIVTSRNERVLFEFKRNAPHVIRLLSVGSRRELSNMQNRADIVQLIDGVSIHHRLLTYEVTEWLRQQNLLILAWTVNDIDRVAELVKMGVDAITTDNLGILELLGGQQRREAWLRDRVRR